MVVVQRLEVRYPMNSNHRNLAEMKATELYQRSSSMTRADFEHKIAEDLLSFSGVTLDDIERDQEYAEETGDFIRAMAIRKVKGTFNNG